MRIFLMILGPPCIVNAVWAFALASVVPGQLDAAWSAAGKQPLLLAAGWDRRWVFHVRQEVNGEVELRKRHKTVDVDKFILVYEI